MTFRRTRFGVSPVESLHSFHVPHEDRRPVDRFWLFHRVERPHVVPPITVELHEFLKMSKASVKSPSEQMHGFRNDATPKVILVKWILLYKKMQKQFFYLLQSLGFENNVSRLAPLIRNARTQAITRVISSFNSSRVRGLYW